MNKKDEFNEFDRTMRKLVSVPHGAIKAKLDAEKAARRRRPTKKAGRKKAQ